MSNKFLPETLLDVRRVGALIGAGFGLPVIVAGLVLANGDARTATLALGVAVLVLADPLGWSFARRAARPGVRSALSASAGITVLAVPLGAVVMGFLMAADRSTLAAGEVIVATVGVAFVGLLFLGLPIAGLTFVVASVWVGVLRLVVGSSRKEPPISSQPPFVALDEG